MNTFALYSLLLAQADGAKGGDSGNPPGIGSFFVPILAAIVLYYFLIIRPERRKQSTHRSSLESLKKNDRVVTIGGIYGVVTNVQRDADEVTLKVDESTNTKIRVTFSAIARVVGDGSAEDKTA